jgi:tyrosine-protein kinase Etk/Wzc
MSKEVLTNEETVTSSTESLDGGVDIFAVAVAVLAEWRVALITWVVVVVVCVGYVLTLKPQYEAKAMLLPQEGRSEGSLASFFSRNSGPGPLYAGLLSSRSVQDDVIERAGLMQVFHTTSMEQARGVLAAKSTFADTPNALMTITIRDGDAQVAAKIANSYLDALAKLNESMAKQQSHQTAETFESLLDRERQELAVAEQNLEETQKRTGLVAPDTQTSIGLNAIANVRTEITTREVQLTALLQSETEQNAQVQTLRSQLAQLKLQEQRLELGSGGSPVGAALAAEQMPQNNLDILRAQREVKYHESLVTSLANQFETASLTEAFARSAFQVVDRAVPPEHKAWPPRKPYLIAIFFFGIVMGLVVVVAKLAWVRIVADPEHRAQMGKLRRAFGSR